MTQEIENIKKEALNGLSNVRDLKDLNNLYIAYLGRKGKLTGLLHNLKNLSPKERPLVGRRANELKVFLEKELNAKRRKIEAEVLVRAAKEGKIDITTPAPKRTLGHLHPTTRVRRQIEEVFKAMGFEVVEGSHIESEYYNFDALNIPSDHPARDLMDTFWLSSPEEGFKREKENYGLLLRTHTSAMQVHYMEEHEPPFRIIVPGRCFRREATDASHSYVFNQIEGLMVGEEVNLANLKGVIEEACQRIFGQNVKFRWRPGFFPFVEPGLELDISCRVCGGKGCSVCKKTGWVEIIPCGMVHPNVLKAGGLNPKFWQGFAFGMGLDRLAMMKYKINDIRLLYSGDLRFLNQF